MHNLYTVIKYEILHFYGNLSKFSYLSQIVIIQCLISLTSKFDQCYTNSVLHQCLISVTPTFNQCYIDDWSLLHQCLISVTPVFNQCSNGVWSFVYSFSNVKSVSQSFDEILNVFTISEFIFAEVKIEKSIELRIITMHKFIISFFCGLVIIKTDNHKIEQVKNMTIFVKIDPFCCTLYKFCEESTFDKTPKVKSNRGSQEKSKVNRALKFKSQKLTGLSSLKVKTPENHGIKLKSVEEIRILFLVNNAEEIFSRN
ncbi:hypothetical protein KUTeg_012478 [Tegillarca granosa]|uniref:Uncharacterized protein n=1 Tax=Tegillarca granosa TaxID=220873 RepID=A0ABQ9EZP2_TEGGR|nr:hypothetical protein KUTeg_012478 [Tegillarca granosa]